MLVLCSWAGRVRFRRGAGGSVGGDGKEVLSAKGWKPDVCGDPGDAVVSVMGSGSRLKARNACGRP